MWNFSILGYVGTFIAKFLLSVLVSVQEGGVGLGRDTHGMVLTVFPRMHVSMSRSRLIDTTVTFHLFQRGEGTTGKMPLL